MLMLLQKPFGRVARRCVWLKEETVLCFVMNTEKNAAIRSLSATVMERNE